jgi:hypothetical protein
MEIASSPSGSMPMAVQKITDAPKEVKLQTVFAAASSLWCVSLPVALVERLLLVSDTFKVLASLR